MSIHVRPFHPDDWPHIWPMLRATFAKGDTYAFPTDWSEEATRRAWIDMPQHTYVAHDDGGKVLGTYYLKPNQLGNGSHVANCGYVVSAEASGRGVATRMCVHSLEQARELGFLAMQFNLVVSTNTRAVALWHRMGFTTVGTLPKAFCHPEKGLVDAYVMYRAL